MEKQVLFAMLLVPMLAATGPFYEIKADGLDAALDNAVCKQVYMAGVMESAMENVEGTDFQDNIDSLGADIEELQSLESENDFRGFVTYVRGSFHPHLLEARGEIVELRNGNLTAEQKLALAADFLALSQEYSSCNSDSTERYANAKVAAYEQALERAEDQIEELSAKGVDTSGLSELVADAKSEIVDPLKEELEEADSATEMRLALSKYCLLDGCPNGKNFQFAARFGHEKLQSILNYLKDEAEEAGLGDAVDSAQAELDEAKEILDDVGYGLYSEEQAREVWSSLNSAMTTLRRILASLRSV